MTREPHIRCDDVTGHLNKRADVRKHPFLVSSNSPFPLVISFQSPLVEAMSSIFAKRVSSLSSESAGGKRCCHSQLRFTTSMTLFDGCEAHLLSVIIVSETTYIGGLSAASQPTS